MKKFLVSIIAISVATGAMAASTLVSSGENKSAPSATYRAGSLRANKGGTESVITTPAAKNQEIGRIGTISTKKITVSSNKNTGGTTGGTQTGTGSSSTTANAGAMTNAAIQQQLDAFDARINRVYDTASLAANSVVEAQRTINEIKVKLETTEGHVTTLENASGADISEINQGIANLQNRLERLDNGLTEKVSLSAFNERVTDLNTQITQLESRTGQLANAGYLTPADITELRTQLAGANATIETMQGILAIKADKADITDMATRQEVAIAKQEAMNEALNYADAAKAGANRYTDSKVNDTIGFDGTVKQYVDAKVGTGDNVSAKDYTDAKVGDTGSYASARAYTDAKTSGMATKTFVNNRIGLDEATGRTLDMDSTPTVKEYVDGKDVNLRAWVGEDVVGAIGNKKVKEYIDDKFDDAADPENPNGWGSHFKEVNNGLLALGAEYQSDKQQNNENNENATSRITALEQGQEQTNENLRAETERLDGRVESMKGYFNGLNTSFNALNADAVKKSTFNDELIMANAYNTLKNDVDAKVSNEVFGNYTNAVAAKYKTKEDALTDINNLTNLITANTNQINLKMNSADFATQLAADTEFQKLQTDLTNAATKAELNDAKADIADTYASKTAVTKLQEDMTAANNAIETKVSVADVTAAVNSAFTGENSAFNNALNSALADTSSQLYQAVANIATTVANNEASTVVATQCPAGGK